MNIDTKKASSDTADGPTSPRRLLSSTAAKTRQSRDSRVDPKFFGLFSAILKNDSAAIAKEMETHAKDMAAARDQQGDSPLMVAVKTGKIDAVQFAALARYNVSAVDECDERGDTPLHLAARQRRGDLIRVLLDVGAETECLNDDRATPLHIVCRGGDTDDEDNDDEAVTIAIAALLSGGADPNTANRNGDTALHLCALYGSTKMIKLLLENGALIDAQNRYKDTALHYAVRGGRIDVVELLVSRGASLTIEGARGNAVHTARRERNKEMYKLLKAALEKAFGGAEDPHRKKVVREILDTERSYVLSLRGLVKHYLQPLASADVISTQQLRDIFSNIEAILSLHESLLRGLEKRWSGWTKESLLADLFVDTDFRLYRTFVNNFDHSNTTYKSLLKSNRRFKEALERCKSHPDVKNMDLPSLLIMPVQRLPRYALLLSDLIKQTDRDHPDMERLHTALGSVKSVTEYLNRMKNQVEQRPKLLALEKKITGFTERLMDDGRVQLDECELHAFQSAAIVSSLSSSASAESAAATDVGVCHFLLFNDCVLVCSHKYQLRAKIDLSTAAFGPVSLMKAPNVSVEHAQDNLLQQWMRISNLSVSFTFLCSTLAEHEFASKVCRQMEKQSIARTYLTLGDSPEVAGHSTAFGGQYVLTMGGRVDERSAATNSVHVLSLTTCRWRAQHDDDDHEHGDEEKADEDCEKNDAKQEAEQANADKENADEKEAEAEATVTKETSDDPKSSTTESAAAAADDDTESEKAADRSKAPSGGRRASLPPPRVGHSACTSSRSPLAFILGGVGNVGDGSAAPGATLLDDVWVFDCNPKGDPIASSAWVRIAYTGSKSTPSKGSGSSKLRSSHLMSRTGADEGASNDLSSSMRSSSRRSKRSRREDIVESPKASLRESGSSKRVSSPGRRCSSDASESSMGAGDSFGVPSARADHCSAVLGDKLVMFGGRHVDEHGKETVLGDLWQLDSLPRDSAQLSAMRSMFANKAAADATSSVNSSPMRRGVESETESLDIGGMRMPSWRRRNASADAAPVARQFATMAGDTDHRRVFLFGGRAGVTIDSDLLNDTWMFDARRGTWRSLHSSSKCVGLLPAPRHSAALLRFGDYLILHGGVSASGNVLGDTWIMHLSGSNDAQWQWRLMPINLPPRSHHVLFEYNSSLCVVGGRTPPGSDENVYLVRAYDGQHLVDVLSRLGGCLAPRSNTERRVPRASSSTSVRVQQPPASLVSPRDKEKTSDAHANGGKKRAEKKKKESSGSNFLSKVGLVSERHSSSSAAEKDNVTIGEPTNFAQKVQVSHDMTWGGDNPKDAFTLDFKVGVGGFGEVWHATHSSGGFSVACKIVRSELEGDRKTIAALSREIALLKSCRHRFIVAYYGAYEVDASTLWILMQYVELGSAWDLMKACSTVFDEHQVASIVSDVLEGLVYLHSRRIVHRDIKAGNILIDAETGDAILTDFGISSPIIGDMLERVGTPHHMAPEVVAKSGSGAKSDLWSLGITCITMSEGEPPHWQQDDSTAMQLILDSPPPTLKDESKRTPDYVAFLRCCLDKNPDTRHSALKLLQHSFLHKQRRTDQNVFKQLAQKVAKIRQQDGMQGARASLSTPSGGFIKRKRANSNAIMDGGSERASLTKKAADANAEAASLWKKVARLQRELLELAKNDGSKKRSDKLQRALEKAEQEAIAADQVAQKLSLNLRGGGGGASQDAGDDSGATTSLDYIARGLSQDFRSPRAGSPTSGAGLDMSPVRRLMDSVEAIPVGTSGDKAPLVGVEAISDGSSSSSSEHDDDDFGIEELATMRNDILQFVEERMNGKVERVEAPAEKDAKEETEVWIDFLGAFQ